ncbi:MAG: 1-(5-phosphoribosyl)-5-[(5-phosphoribosylamino)methylideneamino]imidazole-4-carboxamide isomerase [Limnochordales bacterium]|nr:1-(5-phosphoribosyl)-5-[(5-phosphoribosylamino)methylideneamino]imidazole-4-carboxamide isomerase [Limnochordales bacterium]
MLRNFACAVGRAAGATDFFLPAIDLRHGRCVRLVQGDPGRETRYAEDPVEVARELVRQGARRLHVVDLDGAFAGEPRQLELVAGICRAVPEARVELGGGLRTLEQIEAAFAAGVKDVIVGSALLSNEALVAEACRRHPGQVTAGIDVRGGRVAVGGWQEESSVTAQEAVRRAAALGVRRFIVTDISQDGTLQGPNFKLIWEIAAAGPGLEFVVSGGVRGAEDVRAAAAVGWPVTGVVVGRALYDRRLTVAEALAAARRGLILRPEPESPAAGPEPDPAAAAAAPDDVT